MASSAALATFVAHLMIGFKRRSGRIAQDGFSRKPCAPSKPVAITALMRKLVVFAKRSPQTSKTKPQSELMTTLDQAIAIAKRQGTCSFELRAAFALAKRYQSTGRPADALAVLAPAL
jgi:hypothetical protein